MIKYRYQLQQLIDTKAPAAEIGVASGLFSEQILAWGVPLLYAVDSWQTLEQKGDGSMPQEWHINNLLEATHRLGVGKNVVYLKGLSVDMAERVPDETLGFIYLDANHAEEAVIQDLLAWYPKLKPGGVMAGHDFLNPSYGVKEAVMTFTRGLGLKVETIQEDHESDASFYFFKPK